MNKENYYDVGENMTKEVDQEILNKLFKYPEDSEDVIKYFALNKYKEYLEDKKTVTDDIFNCKENIIVHQVNMHKKMGSGIAKQIRERFPNVYDEYMKHDGKLGEVYIVPVEPYTEKVKLYIANMYSQNSYGYDGAQYTNYDAMRKGLNELAYHIKQSNECGNNMSLAIPYGVGCGLGGGDWNIVSQIIVEELDDIDYKIYKLRG